jgi:hypothetical protein
MNGTECAGATSKKEAGENPSRLAGSVSIFTGNAACIFPYL